MCALFDYMTCIPTIETISLYNRLTYITLGSGGARASEVCLWGGLKTCLGSYEFGVFLNDYNNEVVLKPAC